MGIEDDAMLQSSVTVINPLHFKTPPPLLSSREWFQLSLQTAAATATGTSSHTLLDT